MSTHSLGIIEEPAIPQRMKPPGVAMEVAGVRAIESIESVGRVLGGVTVHDVEQHDQALRMRSVY